MLGHAFAYSSAPIKTVREVQFGVLSPEEIKAHSVAKIEFPEVMDETGQKVKQGGLMDPRMGTIDRNFKCQTCGEGMSECPGHFGHIELARPVFHIGFLIKIKKILECICVQCGRLKIDSVSGLYCSLRSPRFVFGWLSLFSMGSSNPAQIVVSLRSLFLFVQVSDRLITVSNDKNYLSYRRRCTSVEVKRGAGEERRGCTSLHPCLYFTSLLASRNFFYPI